MKNAHKDIIMNHDIFISGKDITKGVDDFYSIILLVKEALLKVIEEIKWTARSEIDMDK